MKNAIFDIFGKKYLNFCLILICLVWPCILMSKVSVVFPIIAFFALVINATYIVYKIVVNRKK